MSVITASLLPEAPQRRADEDLLQRDVVRYLRWALPPDAEYWCIPNGGQRHKREAARLVGLGVRAGMPDLGLVWRGQSIFVELKTPAGSLSPGQRQVHNKLTYCGAWLAVCRSLAEVEAFLLAQNMPLQARLT